MKKKLYLFKKGDNFRLQESVGGSPTDASMARGVTDTSPQLEVLLESIKQITTITPDPLSVVLSPPKRGAEVGSVPLNDQERAQAHQFLEELNRQLNWAKR